MHSRSTQREQRSQQHVTLCRLLHLMRRQHLTSRHRMRQGQMQRRTWRLQGNPGIRMQELLPLTRDRSCLAPQLPSSSRCACRRLAVCGCAPSSHAPAARAPV